MHDPESAVCLVDDMDTSCAASVSLFSDKHAPIVHVRHPTQKLQWLYKRLERIFFEIF